MGWGRRCPTLHSLICELDEAFTHLNGSLHPQGLLCGSAAKSVTVSSLRLPWLSGEKGASLRSGLGTELCQMTPGQLWGGVSLA